MATSKSAAKRTKPAGSGEQEDGNGLRTSPHRGWIVEGGPVRKRGRHFAVNVGKAAAQGAHYIATGKTPRSSRGPSSEKLGRMVKEAIGLQRVQPGRPVYFCVTVNKQGGFKVQKIARKEQIKESGRPLSDPLDAARERGNALAAEILSQDDMLNAEEFGHLVGTTRETINTWRHKNLVLGLAGAKRGYRFPTWQLNQEGKPFEAIPTLFERLGGGPWAVYRFLVQPHPELGGLTGQEALQEGKTDKVLETAESIARGASS